MKMHIYKIYRIIGRDNLVYIVIGRVNPKMKNKDVCGICFVSAENKNNVSRQFLDRQFLDWVRNRVRLRVRVRVRVRVRLAVQELTVQEVSCNPRIYTHVLSVI